MKTLYTINTVNNFMGMIYDPFVKPFGESHSDLKIYNIMDDSLLSETRETGMTSRIGSRVLHYAKAAESSGADGILVTCTSVNQATAYIRPLLNIPILNIEEPVAKMAVDNGEKIGILATLPTSPEAIGQVIRNYADSIEKKIEIITSVAEGAFDVLCAGDREKHDKMVCDSLYQLAEQVDVIAFAQISMSLINYDSVKVPVYKIGESGLEEIYRRMNE